MIVTMKNIINHATTSTLKAVPLAVMLAMSPLNKVQSENNTVKNADKDKTEVVATPQQPQEKVIRSKYVKYENGPPEIEYTYTDCDGDLSTFEHLEINCLRLTSIGSYGDFDASYQIFAGGVKSLNNYSFDIVGSDGRSHGTWKYSQLIMDEGGNSKHEYSLAYPGVIEDVLEDMNSPANNTDFEIKNITRPLYPGYGGGLSSYREPDLSWIQKVKDTPCNFGSPCFLAEVQTQVGKYSIIAFSNDSDRGNYETLVFNRDDGLKFKLDGLRQMDIVVKTDDIRYNENIVLNAIDISWPNVGKFTIYDDELFNALLDMAQQDKDNNNAIPVSVETSTYEVDEDGVIYNKSEKIERIL